jgi:hypothetical protein
VSSELSIGDRLDSNALLSLNFSLDGLVLDLPELFAADFAFVEFLALCEKLEGPYWKNTERVSDNERGRKMRSGSSCSK